MGTMSPCGGLPAILLGRWGSWALGHGAPAVQSPPGMCVVMIGAGTGCTLWGDSPSTARGQERILPQRWQERSDGEGGAIKGQEVL